MYKKLLWTLLLILASENSSACTILGDSIAVGLQKFKPECNLLAKGGINTWQWSQIFNSRNESIRDQLVVISLGTNDHSHIKTQHELLKIRSLVSAPMVIWVLPAGNLKASGVPLVSIQGSVLNVANHFQDNVIEIPELSSDRIHPTWAAYKALAGRL